MGCCIPRGAGSTLEIPQAWLGACSHPTTTSRSSNTRNAGLPVLEGCSHCRKQECKPGWQLPQPIRRWKKVQRKTLKHFLDSPNAPPAQGINFPHSGLEQVLRRTQIQGFDREKAFLGFLGASRRPLWNALGGMCHRRAVQERTRAQDGIHAHAPFGEPCLIQRQKHLQGIQGEKLESSC